MIQCQARHNSKNVGGEGQGLALIFIPAGEGGTHGGTPPPWTPSPPPPSAQVHPKTWVLGTFFSLQLV